METIVLAGGGGHCKSCIEIIEKAEKFSIIGILDRNTSVQSVLGYPVLGDDNKIIELVEKRHSFLVTVGQIKSSKVREIIFEKILLAHGKLPIIIAPNASISKYAVVEKGTIVMQNCIVNVDARIGFNTVINNNSLIEHDVVIGNHCHISTNSVINGDCSIGNRVFIGSGSVILNGISITNDVIVGAGSIVNKDIKVSGTYVGNPAKKIN